MNKKEFLEGVLIIGVMFMVFMLGIQLGTLYSTHVYLSRDSVEQPVEEETYFSSEELTILNNCSNMDVVNTSYCLLNSVVPIFNYTIRDETIKSFDDIKTNGGDCYDWTHLYIKWAEILGFNATATVMEGVDGIVAGHTRANIYNDEEPVVCIIDQTAIVCVDKLSAREK